MIGGSTVEWPLALVPNWSLWRWVARALSQVLARLGHRHARPGGGSSDVGNRCEQGVLPEVVGLPPGALLHQVRFGPAAEGCRGQHRVLELVVLPAAEGALGLLRGCRGTSARSRSKMSAPRLSHLMELQADLGDRAGAISTYHHCESVLERELGVAPGPATREAFQRLMAHARPAARSPVAASPAADRPGLAAAQLVGRSAELSVLQEVWRAAVAGRRSLVLVRGGAGVGKTRLVAEVAELARRQGAVVATAQCFGTAGRLALAPVADWLRNDAVRSAVATLDPAWRAEVARLVPVSGGRSTSSRATADAWQRHRFLEGLARALIAVQRPLLLVLDNMQWCDQETLAFITF